MKLIKMRLSSVRLVKVEYPQPGLAQTIFFYLFYFLLSCALLGMLRPKARPATGLTKTNSRFTLCLITLVLRVNYSNSTVCSPDRPACINLWQRQKKKKKVSVDLGINFGFYDTCIITNEKLRKQPKFHMLTQCNNELEPLVIISQYLNSKVLEHKCGRYYQGQTLFLTSQELLLDTCSTNDPYR